MSAAAAEGDLLRDDDPEWVELPVLQAEIRVTEARRMALFDRRRVLFASLLAKGRTRAEIARHVGVTNMAVAFAVDPDANKRKREAPAKKPKIRRGRPGPSRAGS